MSLWAHIIWTTNKDILKKSGTKLKIAITKFVLQTQNQLILLLLYERECWHSLCLYEQFVFHLNILKLRIFHRLSSK